MTALAICLPVVAQIGVLGVVPADGAWEPWCSIDPERWETVAALRVDIQTECASHGGYFTWEFTPAETSGIDVFDFRTRDAALDLRGKRLYFRLSPGLGVGNEFVAYLVDSLDPGTGFFGREISWNLFTAPSTSDVRAVAIGFGAMDAPPWVDYGPAYQWLAFRVADDGRTVWLEHSADCETWAIALEVEVPAGDPLFATAAELIIYGSQGSVSTEGMQGGSISALYIETVGNGAPVP